MTSLGHPLESQTQERPGWIPDDITHDWDESPYAYQTEEELMPGGGPHGKMLSHIVQVLEPVLESERLMLMVDCFMLYRDEGGTKQRIGPDLLLMPLGSLPSAYDLDVEPTPSCIIEVVSPDSRTRDMEDKVKFYMGIGVSTYLVVDQITPQGKLRQPIQLHVWRNVNGQTQKIQPKAHGYLLPEMAVTLSVDGRALIFRHQVDGRVLYDNTQQTKRVQQEGKRADAEAKRAEAEGRRAEAEGRRAEAEARRADTQAKRAEAADKRADLAADRANDAELEIRRLKALLQQQGQ